MLKLFNRKKRKAPTGDRAPQFTSYQRQALAHPGVPPAGLPYSVYNEMEKDSMIQTALTIKKLGVLAAPWKIVPAGGRQEDRAFESPGESGENCENSESGENGWNPSRQPSQLSPNSRLAHPQLSPLQKRSLGSDRSLRIAEFVEENLRTMEGSPHSILSQAMDAFAKGWSTQELIWEVGGGPVFKSAMGPLVGEPVFKTSGPNSHHLATRTPERQTPNSLIRLKAARPKDPSLFGLEIDAFGQVKSLKLQLPGETPVELPRSKFVVYRNRESYARPKGRSDLDAAYRHWTAKQEMLGAWGFHLSRFAMPTVLGRFERGLPSNEQEALLGALQALQDHTALLYPSEVAIDTLGGEREASAGFMEAIEFHNREISRAILGQTLTTDEGKRVGSLALGKVHLQVLLLQLEAIRRELADTVMTEQVIRPLVELNFGPGDVPRFEFEPVLLGAFATGEVG